MSVKKYEPEQFQIRIFGQDDGEHTVDLETLTRVLQGIQKAITILAKDELHQSQSKSLPAKTKRNFSIRCSVPQPGSYVIPIRYGAYDSVLMEDSILEATGLVADKFSLCLTALAAGTDNAFKTIADPSGRKQLFAAFRAILPKPRDKWRLGISGRRITETGEIQYSSQTIQILKRFQDIPQLHEEISLQTVTGHLVKMDFETHCITLKYPPTNTELECYYTDELEVELFENRRELLQITGNVTYENDRETPKRIVDVQEIQFLDLSEFLLDSFSVDDRDVELKEPLALSPGLTECFQFMTLRDERLGIDVIAQTREELEEELYAELKMLWKQSQKPDEQLGKVFRDQKKNFLAAIKEV
jgi:hypothetical protein